MHLKNHTTAISSNRECPELGTRKLCLPCLARLFCSLRLHLTPKHRLPCSSPWPDYHQKSDSKPVSSVSKPGWEYRSPRQMPPPAPSLTQCRGCWAHSAISALWRGGYRCCFSVSGSEVPQSLSREPFPTVLVLMHAPHHFTRIRQSTTESARYTGTKFCQHSPWWWETVGRGHLLLSLWQLLKSLPKHFVAAWREENREASGHSIRCGSYGCGCETQFSLAAGAAQSPSQFSSPSPFSLETLQLHPCFSFVSHSIFWSSPCPQN